MRRLPLLTALAVTKRATYCGVWAGLRGKRVTSGRSEGCKGDSDNEHLLSLHDLATQANSEIERDAFIKQLAEVEQSLASTNAQLDDMHEYTITLQVDGP